MSVPIRTSLFTWLGALSLCATGWAQAPSPSIHPGGDADGVAPPRPGTISLDTPQQEVIYSHEPDGLWMGGTTYKARAASGGFTYVPFLGSDVPRNFPVRFQLTAATVGDVSLPLEDGRVEHRDAAADRGDRVTVARGPVDVHYDLGLDSVEQSFGVDAGGAAGDLVLHVALGTELEIFPHGRGLRFDGPHGGVLYGEAVVFDTAGRREAVELNTTMTGFELHVSAAFLAEAEGQVLVDPVLTTWVVDVSNGNQLEPDVAYDVESEVFIYAYEQRFSGNDTDILFQTFDLSGTQLELGAFMFGMGDCREPAIATQRGSERCLCVFTRIFNGQSEIWGRLRKMDVGSLSNPILIGEAVTDLWENSEPDVGGSGSADPNRGFLVGWTRDLLTGSVLPRFVTVSSSGVLGNLTGPDDIAGASMGHMAISSSTGEPGTDHWNVAYTALMPGAVNPELRGMQFHADGTVLEAPHVLFTESSGVELTNLAVSETIEPGGQDPIYMLAYQRSGGGEDDIWLMTCRDNSRLFRFHLQALEHGQVERSQIEPRIATTTDEFLVSYLEKEATGLGYIAYVTYLDITERRPAISESRTVVGTTGALWSGGLAMASRFSAGLWSSRWIGCGHARFGTLFGNSTWNIRGAIVLASSPTAVGIQSQGCVGVPNSTGERGLILVQGDQSVDQPKTLVATSLPPLSFGYFIVGTAYATVPMTGGTPGTLCLGGDVGRYSNSAMNSGAAGEISLTIDPTSIPNPVGSAPALAGSIKLFQAWHRDTSGGGGPPISNFTNAAAVVFR